METFYAFAGNTGEISEAFESWDDAAMEVDIEDGLCEFNCILSVVDDVIDEVHYVNDDEDFERDQDSDMLERPISDFLRAG